MLQDIVKTATSAQFFANIAKHTGRSIEQVEKDCDRDNFMSPDEAKAYGLVDEVVQSRKEIPGLDQRASIADKK